jgi:hypothetical protein
MLTYKRSDSLHMEGYLDSDFAGDVDDRKSTLCYVFTLAGGAISWKRAPSKPSPHRPRYMLSL